MKVDETTNQGIMPENKISAAKDDKSLSTDMQSKGLTASPNASYNMSPFGASSNENSAMRTDEAKGLTMTQLMFERWHKSNRNIPQVDLKDIFEENPNFNNSKKSSPDHQHHPEYTQSSYNRIRATELQYTR
jgi:hypothetical protein